MESQQPNSARVTVAALVIVLFVMPLLYVLSFGPVVGLTLRGYLPEQPVRAIYYPIRILHDKAGPPIADLLEKYVEIFEP
ncbi:hypothetical protein [Anatilimnocola floriformis]|uniref:hypothetical protein n=1 Tax=Anatilimnocola floriformis TaxID=2948575 RepID=UPI0020C55333|nr:hypothetical protein [Anatilimnocola floriformis]